MPINTLSHNSKSKQLGLNLIELMIVLSIVAIIAGVGLPMLNSTIERNNVRAEASLIATSINFARSEAINKQRTVTLDSKSGTEKTWTEGWTVFFDAGGEGYQNINQGNTPDDDVFLKDFTPQPTGLSILANDAAKSWISFSPQGRLVQGGNVLIAVCNDDFTDGVSGSLVTVSVTGRVSTSVIDPADKAARCTP